MDDLINIDELEKEYIETPFEIEIDWSKSVNSETIEEIYKKLRKQNYE